MRQFPLLTLQDILFSKSFSDNKVSIYLKECQKHNIVWIEGIIAEIFRIMSSTKIDPKSKIHTIFLLREVVKTCQYAAIYLVQCYLLNLLYDIALYYTKNPQLEMNSKYFRLQGYSPSFPNLSELSHNYVILASQILYICAIIRPKQTFQSKELKKDSQFLVTLNKIKQKNSKIFKQSELQKKLSLPQLKLKYKKQIEQFYDHSYLYVDFYMKKLQDYVFSTQQKPIREVLDFKILLKKGDSYLTSEAVARISQMIDFVEDFRIKCKALSIINEMILWGDIQALITVNFTEYFQKIFRQFCKIEGSKGLKKGEQIFPEIKNQFEQKRKFYSDFLRCIEIWALSFPTQQSIFYQSQDSKSPSPIFKNYRFLKQIRKFVFPQNPFQSKMEKQIRQAFRVNSERNKLIIQDLNKEVQQIQDEYKITFDEIKESMENACKNLQKLKDKKVEIKNQIQVHATMRFLIKFQHAFQLQLQRITDHVDQNQLDQTIQKGLIYIEMINRIEPEYDRLKRGKIKMQQFLSFSRKVIDLTGENIKSISANSSKSILDRKSQLRNSIVSNVNKSKTSIKQMTEQTRIKIIRNKYLQRLNKIANRTNSDKDSSLSFSLYNNSRKSLEQQEGKLPTDSRNRPFIQKNDMIRNAKSDQKYGQSPIKSPRQTGKKMFIVTKFVKDNKEQQIQDSVKNKIIENNWNSSKQIQLQKLKEPLVFANDYHFSFIKNNQNIQIKQDIQSVKDQYNKTLESGNTQTNQLSKSQDRKRFKKGVGLAKQFVNLTQKLIGPKKDIITFDTFKNYFLNLKSTQNKKQYLSKHLALINNEQVKVDRLTFFNEEKLIVTFYVIPKVKIEKIKFNASETSSIYLNVSENKDIKVSKNYYELQNLLVNQQYTFEITGILLKTPIKIPQLTITINNQQPLLFSIPFPIIHMIKFKKPQAKWISGKDFQQADKIVSEQFERNKQILDSFSDIQDYFSDLVEIKTQQTGMKKYRTEAKIDKTQFIIQIKEVENKMTLSACLLNEASNKSLVQYFVAESMNLFS